MNMARPPAWLLGALLAATGVVWRTPSAAVILGAVAGLVAVLALDRVPPRFTIATLGASILLLVTAVWRAPFGVEEVLARGFAPADGLFYWNPALWLALTGLRSAHTRASASAAGLVAAAYALTVPSSPAASFCAGAIAILCGPAIAAALGAARRHAVERPLAWLGVAGLALAVWNFLFMEQYRRLLIPRDDTVSFVDVTRHNAELLSRGLGAPTTWPASWIFALRHHVAPDRYEALSAEPVRLEGAESEALDVLSPAAEASRAGAGWSRTTSCASAPCRALVGPSRLLVRLRPRADVELGVEAWGVGTLDLDVNGARVASVPLSAEGGEARVRVSRTQLRSGINDLRFTPSGGAAALGRVTLRRVGGGA
jgi:hypothetical protein